MSDESGSRAAPLTSSEAVLEPQRMAERIEEQAALTQFLNELRDAMWAQSRGEHGER